MLHSNDGRDHICGKQVDIESVDKQYNGASSSLINIPSVVDRKTYHRRFPFRQVCHQILQLTMRRIRRIAILMLTKLTSKAWLSGNRWIIHIVVGMIILSFTVLLGYMLVYVVVRKIVWIYQHSECYTRESSIRWEEGRSHNMTRQCTPITQYRTMLMEQKHQRREKYDRSKICITTLSDTKKQRKTSIRCRNFDEVAKFTWPNHYAYGQKHGYTVRDQSILLDNSRPPAWSKIRAVQYMFASYKCDWVLWLDADTVIMNSSIPLESILPHPELNQDHQIDLIVTTDRRFTANSGVWFIRNSEWSQQYLNDWWNLKSFVRPSGLSLSGDNDAFGYLIRQRLKSSGNNNNENKNKTVQFEIDSPSPSQHIRMIPRCAMNSFGVFVASTKEPELQTRHQSSINVTNEEWYSNPDQWYYSGDFIAHASGIDQKDAGIQLLLSHAA